ncbi:hypothetical protein NLG97_g4172 [Lecanicillium saksenae]|uniref:Uncharacterized protein n=1 Tax=Lecanicillium saksenae TaxID=468837 RepID=A0ACC1QW29_9HYPO|nr:hypothetical protein NLG97_g4172 [Lecanicillium saksenae]
MKIFIALLASVASQAVIAFKVPPGAADGVYTASFAEEDGSEVYEYIQDVAGITSRTTPMISRYEHLVPSTLTKRNRTWCGCGIGMDRNDCDGATHCLEDFLGSGRIIEPYKGLFCKYGSVVAFMCEHSNEIRNTNNGDAYVSFQYVTQSCGLYIAGTAQLDGGLTGGYMRTSDDFCFHDEDSGAGSC